MKKQGLLFFVVLFLTSSIVFAQDGYDWGADKPEAQGKWVYMNNLIKAKEYEKAVSPLSWLLKNTPNLHEDLYKQAVKVYEAVEQAEKNPVRKQIVQDSVLTLYDIRLKNYGNEADVLNRKGLVAYRYQYTKPEKVDELFTLYAKIIELNKQDTYTSSLYSYMMLTCSKRKKNDFNDDQVLAIYDVVSELLDTQLTDAGTDQKKTQYVQSVKDQIDKVLTSCVNVDCEFVEKTFGPKFKEEPDNIKIAKKIYSLMLSNKCVSNPLFLESAELILSKEPTYSGYKQVGLLYENQHKYTEAITCFEKAITLTENKDEKAEAYYYKADVYVRMGNKVAARTAARAVISHGSAKNTEAHTLIGDLYMASHNDCKSDDPLQTRAVFIAAYEEYKKAGNTSKMKAAHDQFPSMEEIFVRNKQLGDKVDTGCWIGETVALQKR